MDTTNRTASTRKEAQEIYKRVGYVYYLNGYVEYGLHSIRISVKNERRGVATNIVSALKYIEDQSN